MAAVLLPAAICLAAPFSVDLSQGEVSITLTAEPPAVSLAQDLMLTLTVETPSHLTVALPDLRDRFSGFSLAEEFAMEPVEAGGRVRLAQRWRLVPEPAAPRYRLAPFAVSVRDSRAPNAPATTFATRPVVFPDPAARPSVTGAVEVAVEPIHIRPTARTVALWTLMVISALAVLAGGVFALARLSRGVRERRLSPVERAMVELRRLMGRNLPARGLFKEFYIELTMVVRRYIECTRGIRAPGQTTQEFLRAAAEHPSFTPDVVRQLKEFLESADLIKFAGQKADIGMTDAAAARAREYINHDSNKTQGERYEA